MRRHYGTAQGVFTTSDGEDAWFCATCERPLPAGSAGHDRCVQCHCAVHRVACLVTCPWGCSQPLCGECEVEHEYEYCKTTTAASAPGNDFMDDNAAGASGASSSFGAGISADAAPRSDQPGRETRATLAVVTRSGCNTERPARPQY